MNLYQIQTEHLELLEKAEEIFSSDNNDLSEMEAIQEALDLNAENFKAKALSYVQFTKNLSNDIAAIDNEIKRLQALKKTKVSLIDNLEIRLKEAMGFLGIDKIDLNTFKLSLRKSKITETKVLEEKIIQTNITESLYNKLMEKIQSEDLNAELDNILYFCDLKIVVSPNKKLIKESIESGANVYGAEVKENKSLVIK